MGQLANSSIEYVVENVCKEGFQDQLLKVLGKAVVQVRNYSSSVSAKVSLLRNMWLFKYFPSGVLISVYSLAKK